ncbi:RICIN domain-containing protein [Dactylosporangium sp. CA-092794]|uniref:RICIN domain-containing protein n=1 Tax=Dactylosporangium sp. CA-092794 TaxID=3239929 RepID=UPI003D8AF0AF
MNLGNETAVPPGSGTMAQPRQGRRGVRVVAALVGILVSIVSSVVLLASPAHADVFAGWTGMLRSMPQGQCLDSNYNGEVYTLGCNGGQYQQWRFVHVDDGSGYPVWALKDQQTQRCLRATDSSLSTVSCGSDAGTFFYAIYPQPDHNVLKLMTWTSGGCLDANLPWERPYIRWPCDSDYQDWHLGY